MIELVAARLDHPRTRAPMIQCADLQVGRGEVVWISAASGAGGSRLFAALLGDAALDAGAATMLGHPMHRLRRSAVRAMRRRLGVVPQDLGMHDDSTVFSTVALPLEIDGESRAVIADRVATMLRRLDLVTVRNTKIGLLPMAVRQRASIARALVRTPDVILADQPTVYQDEASATLIATALQEEADRGAAVIVLGREHHLRALCQRHGWRAVALLEGELVAHGVPVATAGVVTLVRDTATGRMRLGDDTDQVHAGDAIPNVVKFPVTVRSAGAR